MGAKPIYHPDTASSGVNPRRRFVERFSPGFRRQPSLVPGDDLGHQLSAAFGYTLSPTSGLTLGYALNYTLRPALDYTFSPTLSYKLSSEPLFALFKSFRYALSQHHNQTP